jgi:hypothetical protein
MITIKNKRIKLCKKTKFILKVLNENFLDSEVMKDVIDEINRGEFPLFRK